MASRGHLQFRKDLVQSEGIIVVPEDMKFNWDRPFSSAVHATCSFTASVASVILKGGNGGQVRIATGVSVFKRDVNGVVAFEPIHQRKIIHCVPKLSLIHI